MTGSLQIKNDKYYAVLNVYVNGKRKPTWIDSKLHVKGNKTRAEKFLREQIRLYEQKEDLVYSDMLFSEYIRQWLRNMENKIDIITFQSYGKLVDIHICPYFEEKHLLLQDVTVRVLQAYFDEKGSIGRKDGTGGLSACSLRKHRNIINQVMKQAMRDGFANINPCELVQLPSLQKHEPRFYTKEQVDILLTAVKGERLYPALMITAVYGLRRSELCGLQWNSVNFENDTLTIRHTVVKAQTLVEKDKTKSASSYRTYPLLPKIKELLLIIREQQALNRRLFGKGYQETPYIFTWDDGTPLAPDYISHSFHKILVRHNLPIICLHELRHSCASILLSDGATLKDVQEWLGHADISMTANVYGHLDMGRKQKLANSMGNLLTSVT